MLILNMPKYTCGNCGLIILCVSVAIATSVLISYCEKAYYFYVISKVTVTSTAPSAPSIIRKTIITSRNYCCEKVMFSQACVKNSVQGGRGSAKGMLGYTPLGRHPLPQHYGIRSTIGRYTSYWNAFLLLTININLQFRVNDKHVLIF